MTVPNAPWGPINREGRNEFQILIAAMCVITGLSMLVAKQVPPSMRDLTPGYQLAWAWFLTVGGALIIVSAFWKTAEGIAGWLEVSGLIAIAGATLAYGVAIVFNAVSTNSIGGGPIIIGVGLACVSRAARVVHALWPRSPEEKVRREIERQLVEGAVQQAREIVGSKAPKDHLSTNTAPDIPIIAAVEKEEDTDGEQR